MPPRKKLCAKTPHHTTEVGESSQVRPAEGLTLTALSELHEQDMTDMYDQLEDAQAGRTRLYQRDAQLMDAVNGEAIASRQT